MEDYIFNLKIEGRFFNSEKQEWQKKTKTYQETNFETLPNIIKQWEFVFDHNIEFEIQDIRKDLPF